MASPEVTRLLEYEAHALLERLGELRAFALTLPMVAAATPSIAAQAGIESYMAAGRDRLRRLVQDFLAWLRSPDGAASTSADAQQRFTFVRMRFLAVIAQFDVFADALAERSQHGYGELLAGLDVVAADALELPGNLYEVPPVLCHLDRGAGAAIRRARTRMPGGGASPVAIIRMPRERMVGAAIASSLVHEAGHQGAELLGLVAPLREMLATLAARDPSRRAGWLCFQRWISEIIADVWGIARIGIGATMGLIGVVSLPKPFVMRASTMGPHPPPWIRVKISAAVGKEMYPDPQWDRADKLWDELYPLSSAGVEDAAIFRMLAALLPDFVRAVLQTRAERLAGEQLINVFPRADRTPAALRRLWSQTRGSSDAIARVNPCIAFAAVGQARADGAIGAKVEARLLRRLLRFWALRATVSTAEACAHARRPGRFALTA